jgi:hypothetical protein
VDVGPLFIAYTQPAKLIEPGKESRPQPAPKGGRAVDPRAPRSGGIAPTSASASCESFRFAPVRRTASSTPRPLADQATLTAALGPIGGLRPGLVTPVERGWNNFPRSPATNQSARSEPIQQRKVDQIPHSRALPIAQAPPACHPGSATGLLGEHLPGNAATKDEDNASEARAIRDTRPPTLWSSGWNRQERLAKIP